MTNLPITTSAPQTAALATQNANSAETGDAQNSPPFGEVLARQINEPTGVNSKVNDKLAVDMLVQLDAGSADSLQSSTAPDSAAQLPTDMLAALLPQIMNTPAIAANTAKTADTAPISNTNAATNIVATAIKAEDGKGLSKNQRSFEPQQKVDNTKDVLIETEPAAIARRDAPIATQPFTAALQDSASRLVSGMEPRLAATREVIASAPQPNAATLASMPNIAAGISAPVIQPAQLTLNTPVTQEKWGNEFSQKITWLATSRQDQSAELHLNPPQLGPLDVVIKVSGDQATALFTSPHAAVREAIEQAMPRLRDMLADNGITLGNTTVSDQTPRDQNNAQAQRSSASNGNDLRDPSATGNSLVRVSPISRHNGIVDTFA